MPLHLHKDTKKMNKISSLTNTSSPVLICTNSSMYWHCCHDRPAVWQLAPTFIRSGCRCKKSRPPTHTNGPCPLTNLVSQPHHIGAMIPSRGIARSLPSGITSGLSASRLNVWIAHIRSHGASSQAKRPHPPNTRLFSRAAHSRHDRSRVVEMLPSSPATACAPASFLPVPA